MKKKTSCYVCCKQFIAYGREKCCSDDCRAEGKRLSRARHYNKAKAVKAHKPTNWAEITKKCKAAGLTYGQAVAKGVI